MEDFYIDIMIGAGEQPGVHLDLPAHLDWGNDAGAGMLSIPCVLALELQGHMEYLSR